VSQMEEKHGMIKLMVFLFILMLSGCSCVQSVRQQCYEDCEKQIWTGSVQQYKGQCSASCAYQICDPF
jgi:hypothetical protein